MKYRDELNEIVHKHPLIFGDQSGKERDYDHLERETFAEGEYRDVWGCVWKNVKTGMQAMVKEHPVPAREDVHALDIPEEDDNLPHGFMYLRLADLRGFEEIMIDFAEEPPELQMLIDKVLEYNMKQVEKRLEKIKEEATIVYFGDDLGMQASLPMSPEKWRKYLKPCFLKMYKPIRDAGHYVYMHTDGHIHEIIPDLKDAGVNVVNPQVGANGLDNLARVCKGEICVDLDLNRQKFPFWGPEEIDAHIKEAVEKLGSPEGGLWIKAEIGEDVPLENIEAICTSMENYSEFYS
jgi:hypothetical protein